MNLRAPKILIIKLSAIGDVVHTLPALNALRAHYPKAHITWLVEEAAAELIINHPALDRVLISRRKTWATGMKSQQWLTYLGRAITFVKQLRDTHYDIILDFQAALKGAVLIALARGSRKIGFGPGMEHQEHSYLVLNEKIPKVSMEIHALKRSLMLLQAIGVPHESIEYHLLINDNARQKAAQLLDTYAINPGRIPIAITPIAKWETKLWPLKRFSNLADQLIDRYKATIYFTGDLSDRSAVDQIIKKMHHKASNLAGQTSLIELAAFYQQMTCVVSTDTGPMHIAAAVNTPVVAIFGPTAEWRTGPYGSGHKIVSAREKCRPCFKRTCDSKHQCMQSITVDTVMQNLATLL